MSIVSVHELSPKREATLDILAGWQREYVRAFLVRSDTADENIVAVRYASGVPAAGAAHPHDARAYLIRKQVAQATSTEDGRKLWIVTCNYATLKKEQKKKLTHPLDRPYEIDWVGETFQTIAEKDIFGKGIMNSAGQYFDPPIQVDDVRPVLTITRNEATFDGSLAEQYQNSINNAPFFGGAAYTVKCKSIKAKRVIEEFAASEGSEVEVEFWTVTYEFHYNRDTWWLPPLDQGRYELDSGGDKLVSIKDSDGAAVNDPVPLDGAGHQVPPNDLPGGAVFFRYRYYTEMNFNNFNF